MEDDASATCLKSHRLRHGWALPSSLTVHAAPLVFMGLVYRILRGALATRSPRVLGGLLAFPIFCPPRPGESDSLVPMIDFD